MCWLPSSTGDAPVRVTVGATLLTVTAWLSVLLSAPSESSTWTLTLLEAGPSGKLHTKLPAPVVVLKVAGPTWVPLSAAVGRQQGEVILARIAGGEAVGVLRALVDREVVAA